MDYWLFLGLLLAGCGVGALLTAVVYLTQIKKVKGDLQMSCGSSHLSDSKGGPPQRRSA